MGRCKNCHSKIQGNGLCEECMKFVPLNPEGKLRVIEERISGYPETHIERVKYEEIIKQIRSCVECSHKVYIQKAQAQDVFRGSPDSSRQEATETQADVVEVQRKENT